MLTEDQIKFIKTYISVVDGDQDTRIHPFSMTAQYEERSSKQLIDELIDLGIFELTQCHIHNHHHRDGVILCRSKITLVELKIFMELLC